MDQTSEITNIFVACFPKSGSTYVTTLLSELTGFPIVPAVQFFGQNEQDLFEPALQSFRGRSTVTQQHVKGTNNNLRLMKEYGIRPVVLVRDIFDVLLSLHDHFEREGIHTPVGYIHHEYQRLSGDERLWYLIHVHAPWYFNFYMSWREAAAELDVLWMTYEEFFADQEQSTQHILDFYSLSGSDKAIRAAISEMGSRNTRLNVGQTGRGARMPAGHRRAIHRLASVWQIDAHEFARIGLDPEELAAARLKPSCEAAGPILAPLLTTTDPAAARSREHWESLQFRIGNVESKLAAHAEQRAQLLERVRIGEHRFIATDERFRAVEQRLLGADERSAGIAQRLQTLEEMARTAGERLAILDERFHAAEQQHVGANLSLKAAQDRCLTLERRMAFTDGQIQRLSAHKPGLRRRIQSALTGPFRAAAARSTASRQVAPAFQQLGDDSILCGGVTPRYRLETSDDLTCCPYLAYPLEIARSQLCAILLAPILEGEAAGRLGVELVSPHGEIIRNTTVSLDSVDRRRPIRFPFAPIGRPESGIYELRVFAREAAGPIRLFEWRRARWGGLGSPSRRPFCGYCFNQRQP